LTPALPVPRSGLGVGRDVYTVSRLNAEVRAVLETGFPLIWVQGELSNLSRPSSGHLYFSLKDSFAQVRCALFRMRRTHLRFEPRDGMEVLVRARISLYEARGEYQLIVEHMEPAGEGALRQALEVLKTRLAAEGLFDTARKKPLPPLPRRIGVLSSASGAAIHDVLTVLGRRFPSIPVVIYPIPVQGAEAPPAIVEMLRLADARGECDVLLLTRGGGSLEDLMAFNDERVARAIFATRLPIVSAVGHEIDITVADLVADRRAATPSAAAELLSPDRTEVARRIDALAGRLGRQVEHRRRLLLARLERLTGSLRHLHPRRDLEQRQQRLDDLEQRRQRAMRHRIERGHTRLERAHARLHAVSPTQRLQRAGPVLVGLRHRLHRAAALSLERRRARLAGLGRSLEALSPLATLERGYSITRRAADGAILRDAKAAAYGDLIETRLADGRLLSRVEKRET